MRRRTFITLLGSAAATWPVVTRAQQPAMPTVGWLSMRSESDSGFAVAAVRRGLNEGGYIDGSNVVIEFHWLDNNYEQLPSAIRKLVDRRVSVIVVIGSNISALAAKSATDAIPIVFANGGDPIRDGLVRRLNQPGGNFTGATFLTVALGAKRLELLHALVPNAAAVAMLINPRRLDAESQVREAQAAARAMSLQLHVFNVRSEGEVEAAFAGMIERKVTALLVGTDPFFTGQRHRLAALAARYRLPAIYSLRE